jgi:hypothetical protein
VSATAERPVTRIAYTRAEAAAALGMSLSHFQRFVQLHVRCVYVGQLRLYLAKDLERWAVENAVDPACGEEGGGR